MSETPAYDRGFASGVDAALYGKYVTPESMQRGFEQAMREADDMQPGQFQQDQKDFLEGRIAGYNHQHPIGSS